jgi:hypothetical protein
MLHVTRYGRYWAVWDAQDLVVVTVYKKGAEAVLRRLQARTAAAPRRSPRPSDAGVHGAPPGPGEASQR